MAYFILRIVLFVGSFALLYYLLTKLGKKTSRLAVGLSLTTAICIFCFSMMFPMENLIKPFKSPEEAFKYQTRGELLCVLEGESSALGVTREKDLIGMSNEEELVFISKGDNNAYGVKGIANFRQVKQIARDGFSYTIYQYKGTNDYYVVIHGFVSDLDDVVFSDSQNTIFKKILSESYDEKTNYVSYGTVWTEYPDVDEITISFPSENKQLVI